MRILDLREGNLKLIIQIPCYNEAETLAITVAALPRRVAGFDCVELLVINDGSTDDTKTIAKTCGVDHIVDLKNNQGLARGFMIGLDRCLTLGADVIVNTDADNQYQADDIPKLVQPILDGKADYVIGARPIEETAHFSVMKKKLQKFGSWVVRKASDTDVPDAPSGFRAISKECALRLNVYSRYSYTLETIIQAGQNNMVILSVPIRTNKDLRPSRLFPNTFSYISKSIATIVRIFVVYQPFRFFIVIATVFLTIGLMLGLRFVYFYFSGHGDGYVQSVILAGVLLGMGFQTVVMAFMADLMSVNRNLLEKIHLDSKVNRIAKLPGGLDDEKPVED